MCVNEPRYVLKTKMYSSILYNIFSLIINFAKTRRIHFVYQIYV